MSRLTTHCIAVCVNAFELGWVNKAHTPCALMYAVAEPMLKADGI